MLFYAKKSPPSQLAALALLCLAARGIADLHDIPWNLWLDAGVCIGAVAAWAGVGFADGLSAIAHRLVAGHAFLAHILSTLADIFASLRWPGVIGAGLLAGVGEELFFRGTLQPWIGLPATVLLFTLAHIGSRPLLRLALWTALEGIWFGLLYTYTGNLLYPMLVHGLHDIGGILVIQYLSRRPELLARLKLDGL